MKILYKQVKRAFSLLELSISILIVSVIVVVCVPLIMDQMKKTDEYSYFLAFKTVEKLGTQIVALGDPVYDEVSYNPKNIYDDNIVALNRSVDYIDKFTNGIIPKAHAGRTVLLSFPSYEYDLARICNGNPNVYKDYKETAGMEFSQEDIANFDCPAIYFQNSIINMRFGCRNNSIASTLATKSVFASTELDAQAYCDQIANECQAIYSSYNLEHEFKEYTLNQQDNRAQYHQCIVYIAGSNAEPDLTGALGTQSDGNTSVPGFNLATCNGYGYYNTIGSLVGSNCSCSVGYVPAINHPNICCPAPPNSDYVSYADNNNNCAIHSASGLDGYGCKIGTYNEKTGNCCPVNSYYSRTLGHCTCAQGFVPDNISNLTSCNVVTASDCPGGYHKPAGSDICVINEPITKGHRFCELIVSNYNTTYNYCDSLKDKVYNEELFDNITKNETQYLSVRPINGAFNSVKPNIVFSNGLKLWILGDKVASIPGLSFNPTDYTPDINVCNDQGVYTKTECSTKGDTNYFCASGNQCFTINNGGDEKDVKLRDARNCCSSVDFEDLRKEFAGSTYLLDPRAYAINGFTVFVDINGEKDTDQGGGTLWKDVFPFYVSANGKVYPGYPLNANKHDISLYQGGNSSALSSDVYYYDIIEKTNGEATIRIRKKRVAHSSIPYARALCYAMQVSAFTPYCQNLGNKHKEVADKTIDKFIYSEDNPCWRHRCYVHVKNRIKFL